MRGFFVILLIIGLSAGLYSRQVIENPKEPLSKKAGRVLQLKEEMRISDELGGFYFRNPENIKVSPDGSLFVVDGEQFLRFDAQGKFIKNLFKKGEGPGEFQRIENYLFCGDEIIVHQALPNKIVRMDREGNLIKEFRPEKRVSRLIALFNGKYVMAHSSFPVLKKEGPEPEIIDIGWSLLLVSDDGKVEETGHVFTAKWFAKRLPTAIIANNITDFSSTIYDRKYLVIHHTQDYLLKILDLEKNQIIRTFKREYKSIKYDHRKAKEKEVREHVYTLEPPVDYYNDIQRVFIYKDKIWALTSTWDDRKGILVDVFNREGKYVDNFFLPLSKRINMKDLMRHPLAISGDFLFIVETDENEIPAIVKYKILD